MAETANTPAIVEYASEAGFEQTLGRLVELIYDAGMNVFARIDHAAGARSVGLDMPPTVLLLYGHPRGGTPIMRAFPLAALELPLRVLVRQDSEGRTRVSFHPIVPWLAELGVPAELASPLETAQRLLLQAVRS
ncbi:MAG: DUF302 domain-containing protein [Myxococcales bacterium]|nr:DUF302 domain-containing protein [Myxococcales bacterium]